MMPGEHDATAATDVADDMMIMMIMMIRWWWRNDDDDDDDDDDDIGDTGFNFSKGLVSA